MIDLIILTGPNHTQLLQTHYDIKIIIMNAYRQKSSADAEAILESGISTLDALTSSLAAFPYQGSDALSTAESAFVTTLGEGDVEKANDVVDAAYTVTRDALAMGTENVRTLERFVGLHVPQMGELLFLYIYIVGLI